MLLQYTGIPFQFSFTEIFFFPIYTCYYTYNDVLLSNTIKCYVLVVKLQLYIHNPNLSPNF